MIITAFFIGESLLFESFLTIFLVLKQIFIFFKS